MNGLELDVEPFYCEKRQFDPTFLTYLLIYIDTTFKALTLICNLHYILIGTINIKSHTHYIHNCNIFNKLN